MFGVCNPLTYQAGTKLTPQGRKNFQEREFFIFYILPSPCDTNFPSNLTKHISVENYSNVKAISGRNGARSLSRR